MLQAERVRVVDRLADLGEDPGALRGLERASEPSELEALDVLHDEDRRVRLEPDLVDLDDAPIAEQRERACLAEERVEPRCHPPCARRARPWRRRCD